MKPVGSPSPPAARRTEVLGVVERTRTAGLQGHNLAPTPTGPRPPCEAPDIAGSFRPGGQDRTDDRLRVRELRCRCATPGWCVGPPGIGPGRPAISGRCRPSWLGTFDGRERCRPFCLVARWQPLRYPSMVVPGVPAPPPPGFRPGAPLSEPRHRVCCPRRAGRHCPGSWRLEATRASRSTSSPCDRGCRAPFCALARHRGAVSPRRQAPRQGFEPRFPG
jgi:hypothetical protein